MKKGFTLIEIIMVVIILGLALPVIIQGLFNATTFNVNAGIYSQANAVGTELMEEIKARRFDERSNRLWTPVALLGPDGGENPNDKSTFDDIDDYNNWTDTISGSSRSISVFYVTSSDLNTNAGTRTEMKRVAINISQGSLNTTLVSVFSSHN